ncbi:MAG: PD-(D/E)XK nuclease family protein, partial [Paludibacteraceae bacterium]
MKPFLYRVASTFYNEYQADIRKFTFVFPNRRAGLFFRKYLTEIIDKPIFSPEISTINDCFFNASSRKLADRTAELFRLYRIYKQISNSNETFDAFFFWGEMLLADFNDIDKSRADASKLFKNISALKEIDWMTEYVSENQRIAIEHFWSHFMPVADNQTKEDFIAIWKILLPLYETFRKELDTENLGTEGMIFSEVAQSLENSKIPEYFTGKQFVFVGFNALNRCEKTLFVELHKLGQADFYWDYESDELRDADNPASHFFNENVTLFPSKFSIESTTNILRQKSFQLIAIPSAVGQTKEVHRILSELYPAGSAAGDWIKTAVVLPDESLLVSLLHSLPEHIEKINVTMGFPLKATPASGLMDHIFELHRRMNSKEQFYYLTVSNILNHQYINMLCGDEVR